MKLELTGEIIGGMKSLLNTLRINEILREAEGFN